MPLLSKLTHVGIAKETTQGVAVAPSTYLPVTVFKPVDKYNYVDDMSLIGNPTKVYAAYQGEKDSTVDLEGFVFPETVGHLLVGAGLADSIAASRSVTDGVTTAASPNITSATANWTQADVGGAIAGTGIPIGTTIITVTSSTAAVMSANASASGTAVTFTIGTTGQTRHRFAFPAPSSPSPSYTISGFNGVEERQYPGCVIDELVLTLDAKGAMKFNAKYKGWPSVVSSTPTPAYTTSAAFLGWEAALSIGGVAVPRLTNTTFTVKRETEVIHTLSNTQAPYNVFAGPMSVDAKVKALYESNIELNHFLTNDQPIAKWTLVSPALTPNPQLVLQIGKSVWKTGQLDFGQKAMMFDADVEGVYNTTDGGPCSAIVANSQSTTY